jgi:sigma-B regulation protein RsbU (phosphoserine phosphatase)
LTYANAGHPHAFRLPQEGPPIRLDATAPPLGLAPAHTIAAASIAWTPGEDLLCLWTDGLVDATNAADEPFGEARLLEALAERRHQHPETIVAEIMALADEFAPAPRDDRTLLVMRV